MSRRHYATTQAARVADQARRMASEPYEDDDLPQRANPPGIYHCPLCGERLSGPPRDYICPKARA